MAVNDLKNQVKERIEHINDEYLLEKILNLIDFETDDNEIFIIPDEHKKEIGKSLEQFEKGITLSNETVKQNFQKWLSK
jgi:Mn-dependent DtxR family transcriptional regulator